MKKYEQNSYLNQGRLRALYPALAQVDKERLCDRLRYASVQVQPVVKKRLSLALVLSVVMLLLVAAGIAEVTTSALSRFFLNHGIELTEAGEALFTQEGPLAVYDLGEVTFTLTQVVDDRRSIYVAARAKPKSGSDMVMVQDSYDGNPSSPYSREGYWALAKESGKPVVAVALTLTSPTFRGTMSFEQMRDGSLELAGYFQDQQEATASESASLLLSAATFNYDDKPVFSYQSAQWSGQPKVYEPRIKEIRINQKIDNMPVTLETLRLRLTPVSLYYDITYRLSPDTSHLAYISEDAEMVGEDMLLHLFDASDAEIKEGHEYAVGSSLDGDSHFKQTGSLDLKDFPEELYIKAFDRVAGKYSQPLKVEVP